MREQLPSGQALGAFTMSDGHVIEYIVDATVADDRSLLVYHHGTPAAGPIDADLLEIARDCGLRMVELVRPGYGGTRVAGRDVASNAQRTAALVQHLGAHEFASCGWSGGGPHTLADVALLEHCVGSLCIAGVAPADATDLDFLAGMGQDNIDEFSAARDPEALEQFLSAMSDALADVTNDSMREAMASLLPQADLTHIQQSTADLAASLRWSLAQGFWGWFDDDIAFMRPWGFDLASITRPVTLVQGSDDLMVPFAHGQWLARTIPGVQAVLPQGEGHLSLVERHVEPALQALAARLG